LTLLRNSIILEMNGNNFGNTHCHCICWFASCYT